MPTPNLVTAALRRGEKQLGCWLSLNSPTATEMLAGAGFDWLMVDMEHTVISEGETIGHLRAAASGGPAEAMVRVPWNDHVIIKRLLDWGARSILVPYVQSVEEARLAAAATRYPPDGIRGFAGMHRANNYARDKAYGQNAADDIFLAVQVESPEAAALAGEIAAVEGIDCVFVGPNDLAANMGFRGQPYAPEVQAMIGRVIGPVKAAGKAAGLLDFNVDSARKWLAAGFDFVAIGSDISLLAGGVTNVIAAHRAGPAAP